MAVPNQIQFATLLVPILGLVVSSAVNSVQEDDGPMYRVFVFSFSAAAIGPIAVASLLGLLSASIDVSSDTVLFNAGLAVFLTVILILGVAVQETFRGIDQDENIYMLIGALIVALYYLLLHTFGP